MKEGVPPGAPSSSWKEIVVGPDWDDPNYEPEPVDLDERLSGYGKETSEDK